MSKPPKRHINTGEEQDVHSGWRKYLVWTSRPGATARVKRRTNRRERRDAKRDLQQRQYDSEE